MHGARATSDLYREALRSANPGVYDAGSVLDVERELRPGPVGRGVARADDDTIAALLGVEARLVAVQATLAREQVSAAPPPPLRLTLGHGSGALSGRRDPRPVSGPL